MKASSRKVFVTTLIEQPTFREAIFKGDVSKMGKTTVRWQTQDVWTVCQNNQIAPNNQGNCDAWVGHDWGIIIYDSQAGVAPLDRIFLLVSPDLSNKYLTALITLIRKKKLTCGFAIREARAYQTVYVIDPNIDFEDAALAPLALDGTVVTRVLGHTPQDLAQNLAALIP